TDWFMGALSHRACIESARNAGTSACNPHKRLLRRAGMGWREVWSMRLERPLNRTLWLGAAAAATVVLAAGPAMAGALGPYSMSRDASGTSWQPDVSEHEGLHIMQGPWMFMGHATLNAVWDTQSGPRGDDKAFVSGMAMGE